MKKSTKIMNKSESTVRYHLSIQYVAPLGKGWEYYWDHGKKRRKGMDKIKHIYWSSIYRKFEHLYFKKQGLARDPTTRAFHTPEGTFYFWHSEFGPDIIPVLSFGVAIGALATSIIALIISLIRYAENLRKRADDKNDNVAQNSSLRIKLSVGDKGSKPIGELMFNIPHGSTLTDEETHQITEFIRTFSRQRRNRSTSRSKTVPRRVSNLRTPRSMKNDVFLCHADVDKKKYVRLFSAELEKYGISYWLDEAQVRWGDSIIKKINEGISGSRYVLVFLTESFIGRNWPEAELQAALARQNASGEKIVLPLQIAKPTLIRERYPLLADLAMMSWQEGMDVIIDELGWLIYGDEWKRILNKCRYNINW